MRYALPLLLLGLIVGCGPQSTAGADSEALVRAAIAKVTDNDAASISMDRPISDAPLDADDLDFVEIIMALEDRTGVEITDATIERHGGKIGDGPIKVTPNQLVKMVEDSR